MKRMEFQFFGFKFRKKFVFFLATLLVLVNSGQTKTESSSIDHKCGDHLCINGDCVDGNCTCHAGWKGSSCQLCGGRVRLTEPEGIITHGIGNYSIDMQCTWLIDGTNDNRTIQLYIDDFATECGWDHVYIYDGDSVYTNLLAVYSGMVQLDRFATHNLTSLEAKSGSAYVHFYSDAAYNMTGFKISYKYHSCPSISSALNCSGNGACDPESGQCTCNAGWGGRACSEPHCPRDCSGHGDCDRQKHRCRCHDGYKGSDCSQPEEGGYWELLPPSRYPPTTYVPAGRASHAAVVKGDSIWLFGGESFTPTQFVVKYDINGGVWEETHTSGSKVPKGRYGHSAVLRGDNVYMYGGVRYEDDVGKYGGGITGELWALDTTTHQWELKRVRTDGCYRGDIVCGPLAVVGHSAVVVGDDRMLVLFGHSPVYGYVNYVQTYHFGTGKWSVHSSRGALLKGSYGHSSVWDADSGLVFVYGGHLSDNIATYSLSNLLHSLDPETMTWKRLSPVDSSRFLHSAVYLDGLMLVFGGNTHNDTSYSQGARCYSQSFLAYDPSCDRWHTLREPAHFPHDLSRYGHASVTYEGSMYIVGGYNGRMFSDVIRFTPGDCRRYSSKKSCLGLKSATIGAKCAWNKKARLCEPLSRASAKTHDLCPAEDAKDRGGPSPAEWCAQITSCPTCIHSRHDCVWCGSGCAHQKCKDIVKPITSDDQCQPNHASNCNLLHNCHACHTESYCKWEHDHKCYTYIQTKDNKTEMASQIRQEPCGPSCSERTTCANCTAASCMWCINKMRCVENNAYVASFPYGQCMEWTTQKPKCDAIPPGGFSCNAHKTCERCQEDPGCGWCDNGSGTGVGTCLRGGFSGPTVTEGEAGCPKKRWNFLSCPPCQCNGHSTCYVGNSTCQPCGDLTAGEHCHICQQGFFGDPVNGGSCQPCDCNNHGTDCHPETGKCYCNTKGIVGDRCDRCDKHNKFLGDPANGEDCFYNLALDFQFTFNMTKPEDLHFKRINFMNRPIRDDLNTDFRITCSKPAKINITVKTVMDPERVILSDYNCTEYEYTFQQSEYIFDTEHNTTFYVYVYELRPPLYVQVAFSQHPRLNLRQFFITFSTCFLLLLVIAALLWKIKQKYDNYRRRQRLFVEMEQMASRPYAQALLELNRRLPAGQPPPPPQPATRRRHRPVPCPIVLEQCAGNRAALITAVIEGPTGGLQFAPAGVSGISVGTALVADGSSRKDSVDRFHKADGKAKAPKTLTPGSDVCV